MATTALTIDIYGRTYDRDQLATAVLLRLDDDNPAAVADRLVFEHDMPRGLASELAAVAGFCIRANIRP